MERKRIIYIAQVFFLVLGLLGTLPACEPLVTAQPPTPTPGDFLNYFGPGSKPISFGNYSIPNMVQKDTNCQSIFDPKISEESVQFSRDDCRTFDILKKAFNIDGDLDLDFQQLYTNIVHLRQEPTIRGCGGAGADCSVSLGMGNTPITILDIDQQGPLKGISKQLEGHELVHGTYFFGSDQTMWINDVCISANGQGISYKTGESKNIIPISREIPAILAELVVDAYINGYSPLDSSYRSEYFRNQSSEEIQRYRIAADKLFADPKRGDLIRPINSSDDLVNFLSLFGRISPFEKEDNTPIEIHGLNALDEWTKTIRIDSSLNSGRSDFKCSPVPTSTVTP